MQKFLGMIACIFMLAACGPRYEESFTYHAPQTQSGRDCANMCLMAKTNCDMACMAQEQQCYRQAQMQEDLDEFMYRSSYWRGGVPMSAYRPLHMRSSSYYLQCRGDACAHSCLMSYQQCFVNCGGSITRQVQCVGNCPEPQAGGGMAVPQSRTGMMLPPPAQSPFPPVVGGNPMPIPSPKPQQMPSGSNTLPWQK